MISKTKKTPFSGHQDALEPVASEFAEAGRMDDVDAFNETFESDPRGDQFPDPKTLTDWRVANALLVLRDQVDAAYPSRNKTSDGTIGDEAHCPGPSDHCPNIIDDGIGVVAALDLTHDPASGCDMQVLTRAIAGSRDPRIKYIIYNREICSSYEYEGQPPWTWRPYFGSNPHTRHAHFSVLADADLYDDEAPWDIGLTSSIGGASA
ncbi:hypothetical protein HBA54_21735 [Pelagibius litoralis]|uniref:Uncharacterized protein n=1 Tax=Pelagibius litoralis TaxID=374515 RepID=A0A967F198_9PROT|nr:hypothetical protein [Pelagibius litoralis]NIA71225.1 hypothetical protein [Pelagibius litoralis]